jgi:hypothetical protein
MTPIKINGAIVDQDDPCAMQRALEAVRLRLLAGEAVEELSIQSPVTRETVRFSAGNLAGLDAEIKRFGTACELLNGVRVRRRFAKTIRFC